MACLLCQCVASSVALHRPAADVAPMCCCYHAAQGMRDLGLESLSAQLSLLGRQVAQGLNSILPADLNPFFDYDEEDEEELDPR